MSIQIQAAQASNKARDLVLSIILDLIGMSSFLIPFLGEIGDIAWAPVAGFLMARLYKGTSGKMAGVVTFLEEILPFSDFIPTFTIMWFYTYKIKRADKTKGAV